MPFGVDVNSGCKNSLGVKDKEKVKMFVNNAKNSVIKAIIFDFDDTLYNGPVWENWGNYTKNYVYSNFENPEEIYEKYGFTSNSNGASFVRMTIAEKGTSKPFYDYQMNNICELNLTNVVVVDSERLREISKKYKLFIVSNINMSLKNDLFCLILSK